ncbi:phytanoyl-CoA dioxygenase family protein [Candidatus Poribacteria bacterium]|nr:phytanoyl-CoA dioxygenase family protein [Candidatus Poribacteria bacterium]
MKEYLEIQKPDLGYKYEFEVNDLDSMSVCLETHGFAIIKDVLSPEVVESLKEAVFVGTDPERKLEHTQSSTRHAWIESGEGAWQLLDDKKFMDIHRYLIGSEELTVHRSAAIIRMPGSHPVAWHTDWCGFSTGTPRNTGEVLNRGMWPSGKWFYLTGSRPEHGGLCVIEDSHVEDWDGPEGFNLTADKRSFYKIGGEEKAYTGFDVPGCVPLFTNGGDMIVFAHRTYHGAFPNQLDKIRLSCAIGFRDQSHHIDIPWEIPDVGKQFLVDLPQHLQKYTHGYTSINMGWRG